MADSMPEVIARGYAEHAKVIAGGMMSDQDHQGGAECTQEHCWWRIMPSIVA